jgi:dTMP kinase
MTERTSADPTPKGPPQSGLLVALEGPSGAGKTTVSALVVDRLRRSAHRVLHTSQPSRSPIGELARRGTYHYGGPALSCLVAADRYDQLTNEIEPALTTGLTVVCDRYVPSALVLDRLDGLDESFIWSLYRYMRWPDLVVFLTATARVCRARTAVRGHSSRFHSHELPVIELEASLYREIALELGRRGMRVITLDTTTALPAAIADLVVDHILAGRMSRKDSETRPS